MYGVNDYDPPKPFFTMSIVDLLKYNKKCELIDKYLFSKTKNTKKHKKTRNKKNRKTRKRKRQTRRILSNNEKLKVII